MAQSPSGDRVQPAQSAPCPFCALSPASFIGANNLAFVIRDRFPVTPYHSLLCPRRHVSSFFELEPAEMSAVLELLWQAQREILATDKTVGGFNIGVNVGETAGQTIFHCHVHLIPRRTGDVPNPRGGVRAVIPGKQSY